MEEIRIEYLDPAELKPHPQNFRRHPDAQKTAVEASILEFGFIAPAILNRRTGYVLDGHLRREIQAKKGEKIAVVVVDWSEDKERRFLASFDRTTALAVEEEAALAALLAAIQEPVNLPGFDDTEVQRLVASMANGNGNVEDQGPGEPQAEAVSRTGDLWVLGAHRLLCGDSTKGESYERLMQGEKAGLMNTDPPYGVDFAGIKEGMEGFTALEKNGAIENDNLTTGPELQAFLENAIRAAIPHLTENPAFYLWHPMLTQGTFFAAAAADILIHRQIIWVKPHMVLTRSGQYHWKHELCFYGWIRGKPCPWYGNKSQVSVWPIGESQQGREHPTQKPVALFEPPMENHTRRGEICLEPFSGSGSQIIAAEKLARRCFAIEIAPRYVDVAVRRWQVATGRAATLEGDGRTFDEVAAERLEKAPVTQP